MCYHYIVFYDGFPELADKLPPERPARRLDVISHSWEKQHAFDRDYHYRLCLDHPPVLTRSEKWLTHFFYNPKVGLSPQWRPIGPYGNSDVVAELRRGLEVDDDIIQQWWGADEVLKLVEAANGFDDMLVAIRCIMGHFETDANVRQYAERVFGPPPADGA